MFYELKPSRELMFDNRCSNCRVIVASDVQGGGGIKRGGKNVMRFNYIRGK